MHSGNRPPERVQVRHSLYRPVVLLTSVAHKIKNRAFSKKGHIKISISIKEKGKNNREKKLKT